MTPSLSSRRYGGACYFFFAAFGVTACFFLRKAQLRFMASAICCRASGLSLAAPAGRPGLRFTLAASAVYLPFDVPERSALASCNLAISRSNSISICSTCICCPFRLRPAPACCCCRGRKDGSEVFVTSVPIIYREPRPTPALNFAEWGRICREVPGHLMERRARSIHYFATELHGRQHSAF